MITVRITRAQNLLVRRMLESDAAAHKNWIAGAVEAGDFERASSLTRDLRRIETLFHVFVPDEMVKED